MSDSLVDRLNAHKPYNAFTDGKLVPEAAERITALDADNARLREALSGIREYANDILVGPAHGPGDMMWHRKGILEIRNRAREAIGE